MNVLELAAYIAVAFLAIGAAGALWRIVRGPATLDRAIATDVLLITISTGLTVWMAMNHNFWFIIFIVVASMIGFVGSVTLSRFTVDGAPLSHREDKLRQENSRQAIRPITPEATGQRSEFSPQTIQRIEAHRKRVQERRARFGTSRPSAHVDRPSSQAEGPNTPEGGAR